MALHVRLSFARNDLDKNKSLSTRSRAIAEEPHTLIRQARAHGQWHLRLTPLNQVKQFTYQVRLIEAAGTTLNKPADLVGYRTPTSELDPAVNTCCADPKRFCTQHISTLALIPQPKCWP